MAKDTGKKLADMMYGGNPEQAAFGVFPQMKPRRTRQDPEAAKNVPVDLLRGAVSGVLGAPGDIESLIRLLPGLDERTILPTSEDIEGRLPFKSDTPVSRAATGVGQLGGGFYTGPGSPLRLAGAVPGAVKRAGQDFAMAAAESGPKIFIGPKAKTWNQAKADAAARMEKEGVDPGLIWQQTGTFRGADGIWRQEIDDRAAKFLMPDERQERVDAVKQKIAEMQEQIKRTPQKDLFPKALTEAKKEVRDDIDILKGEVRGRSKNPRTQGLQAQFIFEHPELYKAYPELQNVNIVTEGSGGAGTRGALSIIPSRGQIPGKMEMDVYDRGLLENPTSTTLHEMQHAVQTLEGMGPGGNPTFAFSDPRAYEMLQQERLKMLKALPYEDFVRQGGYTDMEQAGKDYVKYTKGLEGGIDPAYDRMLQERVAMEYYKRLAGEAEARAVQDRQLMTPAQRMETPPPASYDVPQEDLIVKPPREFADGGPVYLSDNPDTMQLELSKSQEPKMANGGSLSDYVNPLRLGQTDVRRPYAKSRFFNPVDPFAAGKNIKDLYGDLYQSEIGSELMDMRPYGGRYADELSSEAGRLGFARDVDYAARNTGDTGFYRPADFERLPGMTNLSDPTLQKNWSTLFDIGNSYWVPDYAEVNPYQYNYHSPTVEGRTREQQDADFNRMYAARNMIMNNAFAQGKMLEGVADPEQVMRELLNAKENTGAYTSDIDRNAAYADQLRSSAGALSALDVGRGTLSYEQGSAINKAAEFQKYLDDMTRAVQQREQSIRNIEKDLAGLVADPANMDTYNQRKAAYEGQLGSERANLEFARKAQAGYQSALDPYLATIQTIQDPTNLSSADVIGNIRLPNQVKAADGSELQMAGGGLAKIGKMAKAAKAAKEAAVPLDIPRVRPTKQDILEAAERVGRQQLGEHVTNPLTGKTTNLAGRSMKESKRVKNLEYDIKPIKQIPESKPYEAKIGEVNIALPGDQTVADMILHSVEDVPIGSVQEGGAKFGLGRMLDPEQERAFWASNLGPASNFQNKVNEIAQKFDTDQVTAYHLAMGQMANNFAQHFADANMRAIDYSKLNKNQMEIFDSIIAYGYKDPTTKEMVKFPEWPGIANPEASLEMMKQNPNLRKWFNNRMKTPDVTQPLNLPNGKSIEWAITEPEIRNMEVNLTGLSAGRMKPGAELIPESSHQTYSHDIPGTALGHAPELAPFSISFPDVTSFVREKYRPQDFTGTIQKVFPHQVVDEAYLEDMYNYYTQLRKVRGFNDGGSVKKAAGSEITADDLILEERKL